MKAHRTDVVSFAFGLVFLALSVWWLLARILGLTLPPVGWFLAGALILIGVLGVAGALRSGRHADRNPSADGTDAETTVSAPYADGTRGWAGPERTEADEWPTDAVADVPTEAIEDRPVSGPGGEPRWSPSAPPGDLAGHERQDAGTEPATDELPAVGDEPGVRTRPTTGEDRSD
ncbi:hypothetical protein GA0070624_6797 [Micromonospora rhizosphaerae]|uniref:Uncharacterized protein n=1 Tax=Micromonospora rhizosphaerae TaxID=568872 RepID=A0A1C6TJD5_9ACTN|nr:hypothetical protein GA0070624_6785 [Micromonospora rhizosphaerae]SCL41866.1 hypothetical protein GA0070624_6797 [Micromonospora rhizosphaerae]